MTHQFTVSAAAAARMLLEAARISTDIVALVAEVVEGRREVDSCPWQEFGAEGVALGEELRRAVGRSRRAREAARSRREQAAAAGAVLVETVSAVKPDDAKAAVEPTVEDYPWEMRRTSRGMERFYRWPDRSWRRAAPTPEAVSIALKKRKIPAGKRAGR